jgi:hypothetical protein
VRTLDIKQRISASVKNTMKTRPDIVANTSMAWHNRHVEEYSKNPHLCVVCGNAISYTHRRRKTCTKECYDKWIKTTGGYRKGSGTGKHGWFKSYYCDSTYELAYVIYNLDHNIKFERNTKAYTYTDNNGIAHNYYPDFIENDTLIEIKGYWTDLVQRKLDAVKDRPIKLLMKKDIQYMIDYVRQAYNCSDLATLYE